MIEMLTFVLLICPIIGLFVALGGWAVGSLLIDQTGRVGWLHKYGLLVGLGLVAYTVHFAVTGGA